jgi:CheY-like chemotaxis protein
VTEVVVAPPSVVERKLPVEAPAEGVAGRPSAVDPMTSVPDRAAAPATAQPVAAAATMSAIVTGAAALLDQDAPGVISSDGTPAPAMTAAPAGVANDVAIATTPVGTDSASPPVSTQTAPVADCAIETMAGEATPATGTGIVAAGTDHDGAAAAAALPVSHDRAAHTHALEATAATPRLPVADPGIAEGEGIARAADAVARRLDQVADGVIAGEQAVEASAQANDVAPVAVGDEPARAGASAADAGVHDAAAVAAPAVAGDAGVNDVAVIDGDANSDSAADTPSDVTSKGVSSDVIAAGDPDTAAVADATADHVVAALAAAVDSRIDDAPAADAADSAAAMDIAADMPPVVENAASGLTVDQPTDGSEAAPVDDAMTAEALAPPAAAVDLGMAEIVAEAALAIGLHEVAAVPVESGDIAEVAAAAGVDGIEPARPARTVEAADSGRQPADDAAPAVKVDVAADVVVDRNVAAAVPVAEADVVIAPETVRTTAAIGADEAGAAPVAAGATEEVGTVDVTTEVSAPAVGLVPTDTADRPSDETTAVVAGDTMATMAAAAASAAVHRADVGEVEPGSGAATATDAADVSVTQAADGAAVDIAAARDVAGQDATTATASGSTEIATADLEDSAVAGGEVIDSAAAAVVEAGPEQATDIRTESLDTAPASTAPAATPDGEAVDGALPAIAATHVVEHLAPDSAGTTVPEAIEHAVADTDAEPSVAASADVVELMATDAAAAAQPWEVLTTACDPDIEHDSDAAMPVSEPGAGLPVDEHGGLAVVVAPDSSMAEPIAATPAGNATTAAETAESISTAAHAVSVEPAAVVAAPLAPTDISTVVAAAAAVDDVGALSPVIPDESSVHIDEAAPERVAATPAVGGMATKRRRPHPTVYVPPRRVLLVEDDLDALYAMARILSRLGHKVEVAEDGPAALDIYDATGPFDLLVSDKVMDGGMSGPEVARTLQSRQPDLPVLFISADDEDDDEHFVGKPVDQATLAGAIADVVMAPGAMAPGAASPAP